VTLEQSIRQIILTQSKRANVGHIGSALSIVEIVTALYNGVIEVTSDNQRNRFILSKGHAALALYATLYLKGAIIDLDCFQKDGSLLGVHPDHQVEGIDYSTGSLGQGLPIGVGAALAAKLQKSQRRVYVLMSDAECNEGSVWEAVMFAAHHRLSNLTVIIDLDGQQALGYTSEVLSLAPLADKWRAFGWDALEVDGHNGRLLEDTLQSLNYASGSPHVLIAKTTFGKGVSFMENQISWHYLPMSDEQYEQALEEISS
jgi:transketolase